MAVSVVLLKLGPNEIQLLVYYVYKAMLLAKQKYTLPEKVVLALRLALKKLRPYFQAHQVNVLIDVPFRAILHKPELLGD